MKRNRAEEMVKALGGTVKSSVVKELTFLVTNDTGSGSSKNKKANDLGIKILSEEEFISLLSNKKNNYPQEELF
ncbi:MAG: BRCT domain-containing protein, partial [Treponema sp.]|nr:BRCT domain-containing protein [Treponema sp.]